MLAQTDEPPSSAAPLPGADLAASLAPDAGAALLRRFLSVEHYRLYPFTIDSRPLFDRYARLVPAPLSDYTFANNFIWLSQRSGFYQVIEDCFCLFSLHGHCLTMPLPPLGTPGRQRLALAACFDIMDRYNPDPCLSAVEFVYQDFVALLEPGAWLIERALPDYIYRTGDLIGLKGNAYKTKRSEINQFRRAYPDHRMEPLGPGHWHGMRDLVDRWLRARLQYQSAESIADFFYSVEQERAAIERALQHYDRLGLTGLCLILDGRLEGFTFGERIAPDIASVLVEKTSFAVAGSAQYLFREFAKTFADCTWLNVGDDLGFENLRRVKMSYRPARFGEKITLRHLPARA